MKLSGYRAILLSLTVLLLVFAPFVRSEASIILTFIDGDSFDGDMVGDTSASFTDPDTGQSGFIQTQGIAPNGELNSRNAGGLGIRASSGGRGRFDDGEGWVFDWSLDTSWEGISFGGFSDGTETFTVSSVAFQGLSITPTVSAVSFDSGTGAFTFDSTGQTSFNLNDLTGGSPLALSSGVDVSISYANSNGRRADIQSLTFGTQPVPEPGTVLLFLTGTVITFAFRKLRKAGMHKA